MRAKLEEYEKERKVLKDAFSHEEIDLKDFMIQKKIVDLAIKVYQEVIKLLEDHNAKTKGQ